MKLSQRRLARRSFGGMLATRQGSLTLALLCAVLAAGILVFALNSYKSGLKAVTPQTTVLVATAEIPQGTSGKTLASEGLYKSVPVLASQLAAGAITDAAALQDGTAQETILPGQQLTTAEFAATTGVAALLGPNQRAVSISIDEPHGDTDVLQAGDRVDLYATFGSTMVLLVRSALVLKTPSAVPVKEGATTIAGSSMVLLVSTEQAPEVGYAFDNGKIYVALQPTNPSYTPPADLTMQSIVDSAIAVSGSGSGATLNTGAHP
ncbi:MAG: RcpC/CpaB family pilus assembly protein [Solirubrobacteraceae bacterium]